MSVLRFRALLALIVAALASSFALASWAEHRAGDDVVLTVRNLSGVMHVYSRSDLAKMRRVTFSTTTIWTEGKHEFSGVPLSDVLKVSGVEIGVVDLYAANDYVATVPLDEITPDVPIVADLFDGQPMSLRDKGPLWVVYPYDSDRAYQSETTYTRSVWQLVRIEAVPATGD
ncbi:oxidoreductase [Tabrizicola sp. J26]|uniref:oxidoreductase n=1 Tax=Alitabrizicola rongguiensis TaxID=2909234 RepID=UPI001F4155F0|nr:oxidoreductase [Tabrizicola rongguiensis]MCF1708718.1 oxidoreductase [Tabrizicola rongguiensis]